MTNSEKRYSKKSPPAYKGHEFEVLKLQFETQTSLLRNLTDIDLRIFTGYITLQLILGSWLSENPLQNLWLMIGILVLNLTLTSIAFWLLSNSYKRRKEVAATIKNLNEALGLLESGIYLQDKAINTPTLFRPWVYGYHIGLIVGFIGIALIIFAPMLTQ